MIKVLTVINKRKQKNNNNTTFHFIGSVATSITDCRNYAFFILQLNRRHLKIRKNSTNVLLHQSDGFETLKVINTK